MVVTERDLASKNFYYVIALALLSALVCYLFLLTHQQTNNFEALSQAASGVLEGHPHWITYQNRLLGPYTVLLISEVGFSYLTACKIFYLLGITLQIFLLNVLLIKSGCSRIKSIAWVALYGFLFISYQGWWFYTWDIYDALLFTVFAYALLNKKPTFYFVCLFFIALLNRESALFIALFLVLKGVSISFSKKSIAIDSVRTVILGIFLLIVGIAWTHTIRTWLFISSPAWILALNSPEHTVLGNMINLRNFYDLLFGNGTSRDALWVFGSMMLLISQIVKPCTRACRQFARMSANALILEHRSAAYGVVCEQRRTKNQRVSAIIVELSTGPRELGSLFFIYSIMLFCLLLFGAVGESRMYISLFSLFIFLLAAPQAYDRNYALKASKIHPAVTGI